MNWRRGLVTEIKGHQVKVRFPDLDDLVSDWLAVVQPATLGAKAWIMPRKDTQVVVLIDEHGEDGAVLGGIYSAVDAPPSCPAGAWHLELEDGTKLTLEQGKITVDTPGDLVAKSGGKASLEAPNIALKGAVKIDGTLEVSKAVNLKADLTVSSDATISGFSFKGHKHTSGSPGSPTSGPV